MRRIKELGFFELIRAVMPTATSSARRPKHSGRNEFLASAQEISDSTNPPGIGEEARHHSGANEFMERALMFRRSLL